MNKVPKLISHSKNEKGKKRKKYFCSASFSFFARWKKEIA